ncbi:MAG: seg [candidate division WS6 bacterium 34_10]|uniref:Seg n=1 Tax=candidate division WS6 bacterium 34_10 TaxID=1641389 RepID=A0A117LZI0_9BACT|nr:MAG: seg [candidate division WS6 bacterium 34_10]
MKKYESIQGKKKFLFSAPHSHPHRRPSLVKKYKVQERYTDDIVRDICRKTKAFGIYIKDQVDYDPNYHKKNNPYKREIRKIVKENNIKAFFDIHGLSDEHLIDIAIYYKTRFRKSMELADEVSKKLNRGKLRGLNIQILRLPENHQETLTEIVASDLRVPAIQIEIARYIRKDKELREAFVDNLSHIVE